MKERRAAAALCWAHIYSNRTTGALIYCDTDQGATRDFRAVGMAMVPCGDIKACWLVGVVDPNEALVDGPG